MLKSTFSRRLQRCRWRYGSIFIHLAVARITSTVLVETLNHAQSIFIRLAVVASQICEIPRNYLKILTYAVQGHPTSSILVPIESAYATF